MPDTVNDPLVHILVSVWDKAFIDKFVEFALPTHISPGNLPALSARARVHYHFYTNAESTAYLKDQTRALSQFATVHLRPFNETFLEGQALSHHLAPYSGAAFKNRLNQFSVFHLLDEIGGNHPSEILFVGDSDLLYSDGAFLTLFETLQNGAKAVVAPTIRLSLEQVEPELITLLADGAGVSAQTLGGLISAHPHAAAQAAYILDDAAPSYPSQMIWPTPEGLLCRTFFPHPVAMIPNPACRRWESTIDYDFILHCYPNPRDIRMFTDGKRVTICKLSTDRYLEGQLSRVPLQIDALSDFLLSSTNEAHRPFAESAVRYALDPDNPALDRVERESNTLLTQMYGHRQVLLDRLAESDPVKNTVIRSHFGPIQSYLSPERLQRLNAAQNH
ncbi:MAG: hypothetical protein JKY20_06250 [Alphaproteobacteria bacterium]|nr:hypothetical protein [Alphaproteobacteria bacterium]